MSRREAWASVLLVMAVAAVVRIVAAAAIPFPRPEDTAYYVGVARNLVEGRGLVSDAIWSYGTPPLRFPRDAFEVWLPLPSLLAAVPLALSGARAPIPLEAALRAAQVTSVLLGAVLAGLTWRLAADVAAERGLPPGRARTLAVGTGLVAGAYLPLVLYGALPDSTVPFGVLALAACLLMGRLVRDPRGARVRDPRLVGLGVLLGLAALTRNEAAWLALAWAWLVLRAPAARLGPGPWAARLRLVGTAAALSLAVYAPWLVRDALVFGTPFPGQALANALSVTGFDIFAWADPPTLERYLAVGPAELVRMRLVGLWHNVGNVLLLLGLPVAAVGLLALPWQARDRALRPVVLVGGLTFAATTLLFPVATTWGTFLHAAAPVHVLLLVSAAGAGDAALARLAARRGWGRPVAWLAPASGALASLLFSVALLPAFGDAARSSAATYAALERRMAAVGAPLDGGRPVIHDFPIWLAETARVPALALPAERTLDVLDLAATFGAGWLVSGKPDHLAWPAILDSDDPLARCFREVDLLAGAPAADAEALAEVRVFRIACDGSGRPWVAGAAAR